MRVGIDPRVGAAQGLAAGAANSVSARALGSSSVRAHAVWDDFDRSNRLLLGDRAPSGQVWEISGAGYQATVISGGRVSSNNNFYAALPYGGPVTEIRGAFSFSSAWTAATQVWTLIADVAGPASGNNLSTMLHMNFGIKGYTFTKRKNGGSFDAPTSGVAGNATAWDLKPNTIYYIGMVIDHTAGTVTLYLPDGNIEVLTDTDFVSAIVPTYGCIQVTSAGATYCYWDGMSMGPCVAEKFTAAGRAIPLGEFPGLRGSGILRPQRSRLLLSGAAGYYRVLTDTTRSTFLLVGSLVFDAYDAVSPVYASSRKCEFRAVQGDTANIGISQIGLGYARNAPVTKARISQLDTSPYTKALDLYKAVSPDIYIDLEFRGYGVLATANPTVGATALASANAELTFT